MKSKIDYSERFEWKLWTPDPDDEDARLTLAFVENEPDGRLNITVHEYLDPNEVDLFIEMVQHARAKMGKGEGE